MVNLHRPRAASPQIRSDVRLVPNKPANREVPMVEDCCCSTSSRSPSRRSSSAQAPCRRTRSAAASANSSSRASPSGLATGNAPIRIAGSSPKPVARFFPPPKTGWQETLAIPLSKRKISSHLSLPLGVRVVGKKRQRWPASCTPASTRSRNGPPVTYFSRAAAPNSRRAAREPALAVVPLRRATSS